MSLCDEIQERLDEYADGTLGAQEARRVADHLAGCDECQRELDWLTRLGRKVGDLPRSIEPPRDLWPSIEGRLSPGRGRSLLRLRRPQRLGWKPWLGALAAAVLVIGVGLAIWFGDRGRPSLSSPAAGAGVPGIDSSVRLTAIAGAGDLTAARESLRQALDARRDDLSPETWAVVERNLAIIDRAAGEIATAIAKDPGNRELNRLLVVAYEQEVELLRQAVSLPSGA